MKETLLKIRDYAEKHIGVVGETHGMRGIIEMIDEHKSEFERINKELKGVKDE